jgi:hypothetical protein
VEEIKKRLQAQEEGLQVKSNESIPLVQKAHDSNMRQLEASQNLEVTKLKSQLKELRYFNEKGQAKIQRVQMDNELLRNTME